MKKLIGAIFSLILWIFFAVQIISPCLFAVGASKLDYAEMCFREYKTLKGNPRRESQVQSLQNLFMAAHHNHPDAINELVMNYEKLTSTLKLSKTKYRDFIKDLVSHGNSFAAFFAYQEGLLEKEMDGMLINLMEVNNNPAYLTSKAIGIGGDSLKLLDRAIEQGFYPAARKKGQTLYWRAEARSAQNNFSISPHDSDLMEAASVNRYLAENGDDSAMLFLVKVLLKAPELQTCPNEFQWWLRKLATEKNDASGWAIWAAHHVNQGGDLQSGQEMLKKAKSALSQQKSLEGQKLALIEIESTQKLINRLREVAHYFANVEKSKETRCTVSPISSSEFEVVKDGNVTADLISTVDRLMQNIRKKNAEYKEFFARLTAFSEELEELDAEVDEEREKAGQHVPSHEQPVVPATTLAQLANEPAPCTRSTVAAVIDAHEYLENNVDNVVDEQGLPTNQNFMWVQKDEEMADDTHHADDGGEIATTYDESHKKYAYKKEKRNRASHASTPAVQEDPKGELYRDLGNRLIKEKDAVEAVLRGEKISGKKLRGILNALGVQKPTNVRGSHNKTTLTVANASTNLSVIKPHKKSSPHTNTKKLQGIFNDFGIYTLEQLWP